MDVTKVLCQFIHCPTMNTIIEPIQERNFTDVINMEISFYIILTLNTSDNHTRNKSYKYRECDNPAEVTL